MIPGLLAAIAVFSYLLGGLNGAIIASKYVFHRDVRDYGSGNAGLTNFYRTFGAPGLAIVIGTDVLKTVIAVVAGGLIMGTQGAASQAAQNNYLVNTLRPPASPAYIVQNPYCCNTNGCGGCNGY